MTGYICQGHGATIECALYTILSILYYNADAHMQYAQYLNLEYFRIINSALSHTTNPVSQKVGMRCKQTVYQQVLRHVPEPM